MAAAQTLTAEQELVAEQRLAVFKAQIEQFCLLWTGSAFYFGQLLSYVNHSRHDEEPAIRIYRRTIDSKQPASELETSLGLTEISPSVACRASSQRKSPSLVIVEGHLHPNTIVELALQFNIRPEFFLGHLEIERTQNRFRTSFELPAKPSRRRDIAHVRLVSLWRSDFAESLYPRNLQASQRAKADKDCRAYERLLFDEQRSGATRFRKVHLYNSRYFMAEQVVSFCRTAEAPNGRNLSQWSCLFLLDSGQSLSGSETYPWNGPLGPAGSPPTLLHAVRYNERIISSARGTVGAAKELPPKAFRMHPYHPVLDLASSYRSKLWESDPLFALGSLLSAASDSWNQILNFLEEDLVLQQDVEVEQTPEALGQIRYILGLIQRFESFIRSDREAIDNGPWKVILSRRDNRLESDSDGEGDVQKELEAELSGLVRDYQYLLQRCTLLAQRCESTCNLLQSSIALMEAQKSMQQTAEVNKLTKLAFIFVPASFVSTVFGMNIVEIDPGSNPTIWHFILVAISVLIPCFIMSLDSGTRDQLLRRASLSGIWSWKPREVAIQAA